MTDDEPLTVPATMGVTRSGQGRRRDIVSGPAATCAAGSSSAAAELPVPAENVN